MVDNPKAAIMIIAVVSIIAFAVGCVFGSFHVGQDYCEQLIPTSLTSSDDMIKPIRETNTTMNVVAIKQPVQQKTVTKNRTKNYTTNNSTTTNSSSDSSSGNRNSSGSNNRNSSSSGNGNNGNTHSSSN